MPTERKPRDTLVHAHEVGALHHVRGLENYFTEIPQASVRMPMYKANDSDDLHLMELISPAHELHRKLRRPMTQQHTAVNYLPSPNKSLDSTPRRKYKQAAFKSLHELPIAGKLNASLRIFGCSQARPKSAAAPKKFFVEDMRRGAQTKKPAKKQDIQQSKAEQMHQNSLDFDDIRIYNSELATHRERVNPDEDRVTASGFLSERRPEPKSGQAGDDQRASDLRLISKLWHQECKSSISIQQRLAYLLNSKYKEAFEAGRMYTYEKCKHNDFKAEVAQILKNLERAGAPQMATLHVKRQLAVACVDEVFGAGMGEEYMTLEMCFLQPSSSASSAAMATDPKLLQQIVGRVHRDYVDVHHLSAFMLDQLRLSPTPRAADLSSKSL